MRFSIDENMSGEPESIFWNIYADIAEMGTFVRPRGQLVVELENYSYTLPPYVRFPSFACRKLNLGYIKTETLWYLRGDKFDTSILSHAKMWQGLVNQDGSINSNYGQYIFTGPKQFDNVIKVLRDDPDSRRASMMILGDEHLLSDTKDVPCTYALNFRIRRNRLNLSVHMRSQDAIYGMGNDAPAFSFMHEMMMNALRRYYPTLELGHYHHIADSFHVYERHFPMLKQITGVDVTGDRNTAESQDAFEEIACPRISGPDEVDFLRKLDFSSVPEQFAFTRWLTER